MFDGIIQLRERLSIKQRLRVYHGKYSWVASFEWKTPVDIMYVQQIEAQLNITLPNDFSLFVNQVSNGARLFYDLKYGQWGFEIYSVEELLQRQTDWKQSLPTYWSNKLFAFGALFGESNVLAFDLTKSTGDGSSCAVLEGNPYDSLDLWPVMSRSFHEWLDHLVTAQGDKYWLWK